MKVGSVMQSSLNKPIFSVCHGSLNLKTRGVYKCEQTKLSCMLWIHRHMLFYECVQVVVCL